MCDDDVFEEYDGPGSDDASNLARESVVRREQFLKVVFLPIFYVCLCARSPDLEKDFISLIFERGSLNMRMLAACLVALSDFTCPLRMGRQ